MKRVWGLAGAVALFALLLVVHGPIPQPGEYHRFADGRALLGVPNAANVLSNLPFLFIGTWGWRQRVAPQWRVFALAIACTCLGSALYHWAPDNALLVFDRIPIAAACAVLSCALVAERIDARWARTGVLVVAVLLAASTVALWWSSEVAGRGDLRPYLFVQFLPVVLIVCASILRLPARGGDALPTPAWWITLALYAVAKVCELGDAWVLQASGFVSGHTLKHLLAAAAAWWILRAARHGT